MLTGSCFTEHIGGHMAMAKMQVYSNPHGILFNPNSIAGGLQACIKGRRYCDEDLFCHNETWNSWDFHSRFSHTSKEVALSSMNDAIARASAFLAEARWLIITFGSAYQYFTTSQAGKAGYGVANCHKAPGQWFEKKLLDIGHMQETWEQLIASLLAFNPALQLIFTLSPVRHVRDGLIENNRSKARLHELIHTLADRHAHCHYFPAYELVIDVLRDYRFFEQDMVHPNPLAAQYVWEQFVDVYMTAPDRDLLRRIGELAAGAKHRHRFPETGAAVVFRNAMLLKARQLQKAFPYLDLSEELKVFGGKGGRAAL
ncbi:GSCFA domain-containing protein [Taibaiella helva]|uniref:GSCFA domain-containing protein n=1 Tax=Taibaiella helva TaxID=2301235 RepID=UPI00130065ED|nr:GSCFA domain-containing protein [Taibaiella helva]